VTTPQQRCPRCQSAAASTVAQSPVAGRWTMQSCGICWYAWRSTEPRTATDPLFYPNEFRVNVASIAGAPRIV
jgi:vanillate/4-hydroxybenzoate decarboxylase subunit D